MKGKILVWPLVFALGLALLAQTGRWRDRMVASRILQQVELISLAAAARGRAPSGLLPANLEALRRAAALDPLEIGIPVARAGQHLLFRNYPAAIDAYRDAEALEPRPEIYLNLGIALIRAGRTEEGRRQIETAVRLSPSLSRQVPPGLL